MPTASDASSHASSVTASTASWYRGGISKTCESAQKGDQPYLHPPRQMDISLQHQRDQQGQALTRRWQYNPAKSAPQTRVFMPQQRLTMSKSVLVC